MTPDQVARARQMLALRRAWRRGAIPPVPAPRPGVLADAAAERIVRPAEVWDTGTIGAIYPGAGEGWRAPR